MPNGPSWTCRAEPQASPNSPLTWVGDSAGGFNVRIASGTRGCNPAPSSALYWNSCCRSEATSGAGVRAHLRGSPAVGVEHVALEGDADAVAALVQRLRVASGGFDGQVVVLDGPDDVRDRLDLWGPVRALGLMRAVKDRFDPGRLLSPGRFVGGI